MNGALLSAVSFNVIGWWCFSHIREAGFEIVGRLINFHKDSIETFSLDGNISKQKSFILSLISISCIINEMSPFFFKLLQIQSTKLIIMIKKKADCWSWCWKCWNYLKGVLNLNVKISLTYSIEVVLNIKTKIKSFVKQQIDFKSNLILNNYG